MTEEGLLAIFDVALFALKQLDFAYHPMISKDENDSQLYSLTQQIDQSSSFFANTSIKNQALASKTVMFVYNVADEMQDSFDDASSTSSFESDSESESVVRTGFTGIIDLEKNEMVIYPPSHSSYLHKDSIVNLMDIAESLLIPTVFICTEKNHQEIKEFSRAFIYAGFELVQPRIKQLPSTEWVLFGAQL